MKGVPKFTSGMFKKKVKRFGAAAPKMPRMPKPRMKKFQAGGETDDLVPPSMLPDPKDRYGLGSEGKGPPRRYTGRRPNKKPAAKSNKRYEPTEVILDGTEEAREQAEFERRLKELEDRRRAERQKREYEEYERSRMPRVITARSGGHMKKFRKGGSIDGCATKGKTRGKYI